MTTLTLDRCEDAQRRLAAFLGELTDQPLCDDLSVTLIAGGRSNPTYQLGFNGRRWVLRRPPYGHVLPTAHDMQREFRVLSALQETAVPVPEVYASCEDSSIIGAPFYLMEMLDGTTVRNRGQSASLTTEQRQSFSSSMVQTLADLHSIDPANVGLSGWGRPDGYLARQLDRWHRQWTASASIERPQVERILEALHAALPTTRYPGIVHGDFKTDNLIVSRTDPTHILGLLDWEMSTLGDTLADVGVMISFWDQIGEAFNPITAGVTALPGFPTRDELLDLYARRRGIDITGIDWYVVFADFKIAVILEGINARFQQGLTTDGNFQSVGAMVEPLLERALTRIAHSSGLA